MRSTVQPPSSSKGENERAGRHQKNVAQNGDAKKVACNQNNTPREKKMKPLRVDDERHKEYDRVAKEIFEHAQRYNAFSPMFEIQGGNEVRAIKHLSSEIRRKFPDTPRVDFKMKEPRGADANEWVDTFNLWCKNRFGVVTRVAVLELGTFRGGIIVEDKSADGAAPKADPRKRAKYDDGESDPMQYGRDPRRAHRSTAAIRSNTSRRA